MYIFALPSHVRRLEDEILCEFRTESDECMKAWEQGYVHNSCAPHTDKSKIFTLLPWSWAFSVPCKSDEGSKQRLGGVPGVCTPTVQGLTIGVGSKSEV